MILLFSVLSFYCVYAISTFVFDISLRVYLSSRLPIECRVKYIESLGESESSESETSESESSESESSESETSESKSETFVTKEVFGYEILNSTDV